MRKIDRELFDDFNRRGILLNEGLITESICEELQDEEDDSDTEDDEGASRDS